MYCTSRYVSSVHRAIGCYSAQHVTRIIWTGTAIQLYVSHCQQLQIALVGYELAKTECSIQVVQHEKDAAMAPLGYSK